MAQTNEADDAVEKKHKELCGLLNMYTETATESWKSYQTVRQMYTLDGDQVQWLSCALYVECRKSLVPTVGLPGAAVEGNCVSLTKLLRLCNMSLYQFFDKIKKWIHMASVPQNFSARIDALERNFSVSSLLFQKYQLIFKGLFQPLENVETTKSLKGSKKAKITPCSVNALFEFGWCLFVCVRGEFPTLSSDFVNMIHVLLSCIDLVYANCVLDKRKDLLNTTFTALPADWSSESYEPPAQPPCIMEHLCKEYNGIYVEASTMKQYSFRNVIENFFQKSILKGNAKSLTGILQLSNFDDNLKSLNNVYEQYVLSVGDCDERIFLGSVGKQGKDANKASCSSAGPMPNIRSLADDTPLTGRKHLKLKGDAHMTPVSKTTHSVQRLHSYMNGLTTQPSSSLLALSRDCKDNPTEILIAHQQMMGEKFVEAYSKLSLEGTVNSRLSHIVTLYYKLLEHIIKEEVRKKPNLDVQALLGQKMFSTTLFACCIEIVLHAYVTPCARFPWVLEVLNLPAFSFYKIIELVVLAIKEKLTRDTVKHLNAIEEQVLESLSWTSASPLWDCIKKLDGPIPAWNDVKAADNPVIQTPVNVTTSGTSAQANAQFLRRVQVNAQGVPQSPVSSASERFVSPSPDLARQLFKDTTAIKPGQSLLNHNNHSNSVSLPSTSGAGVNKNTNKVGSLGLFFRKFYSLAVVRMKDLCEKLKLKDEELIQKIWTCFEYSIIHHTSLMKDRHVDQILMCAIYIVCKVLSKELSLGEKTFTEIMKCYRQQPQATPEVYRSVLIRYDLSKESDGNKKDDSAPAASSSTTDAPADNPTMAPVSRVLPPPDQPAGQSVKHATQIRGDLISFYNTVYVTCLQGFALKFSKNNKNEPCPLSPLPPRDRTSVGKQGVWKVSDEHNVYIRPLSPTSAMNNLKESKSLTYKFSRSPSKDLHVINCLIAEQPNVLKRDAPTGISVLAEDGPSANKVPCMAVKKLQEFIPDYQDTQ